jgi:hypothetical protein
MSPDEELEGKVWVWDERGRMSFRCMMRWDLGGMGRCWRSNAESEPETLDDAFSVDRDCEVPVVLPVCVYIGVLLLVLKRVVVLSSE